jgi:uncharacterized lipoprotein YmbA
MNTNRIAVALMLGSLLGCRSVEVPRERYFRLEPPDAGAADPGRGGVLRVLDLQLGTALDSDCLLVADGVRLEPRPLDRWVAPLDRLVTDALVLGLSRSRTCALVKGGADPGRETWSLHGRIVDFAEVRTEAGSEARVALELWLEDERGQMLFHDEFQAREPLAAPGPDAAVAALSRGLQGVVGGVVQRMESDGLFAAARPAAPARR